MTARSAPDLTGKVALVTGGARGIGAATVTRLGEAGATVVVGDLGAVDGTDHLVLDVTDPASVAGCIDAVVARHGRLDVVVNNAGIMEEHPFEDHPLDAWHRTMAVNLTGPFLVSRAAVPHLRVRGGTIVNIGSIEGFSRNPQHAAYGASKAGLHGLTGAMAVDLGPAGIRVNAVAPGWIDTDLNAAYVASHPDRDRVMRELTRLHPVGRIGTPGDVADVVVWLAGDHSMFVTGQVITVDGGRLSRPPLAPSMQDAQPADG